MMNNKIINKNIKLAKSLLIMRLNPEDISLLERNPKYLSDSDVELLLPLSHYYHWLTHARKTAAEMMPYIYGLNKDISPVAEQSLVYNINSKAGYMRMCHMKAMLCYKKYLKARNKNNESSGNAVVLPANEKSTLIA